VPAKLSDRKIAHSSNSSAIDYYTADVISAQDYYPFGMIMPGRTVVNGNDYRYGFNGKENDNEVKGTGSQQDYGMRIYDPRLAKFLSVDPLTNKFAWFSPYQFAGNTPIRAIDKDGEEPKDYSWNWESKGSAFIGKWGQDVRTVFDNWTTTTWSVMSYTNQSEIYYWKPYDGSQGTFDFENNGKANKDPKGNWTGAWQRFERQETIQARLGSELADGFGKATFIAASIVSGSFAASAIGGPLLAVNNPFTTVGALRFTVGATGDYLSQQTLTPDSKINWWSVASNGFFTNPFTSSAFASSGNLKSGEKFTINNGTTIAVNAILNGSTGVLGGKLFKSAAPKKFTTRQQNIVRTGVSTVASFWSNVAGSAAANTAIDKIEPNE
jgi:RHS repeat-associated protein